MKIKFEELLQYLFEYYTEKLLAFATRQQKGFNDLSIRRAVESNSTANLSIDELAFLCNLSVSTFKRRFAIIYNTSPHKWLLQRKMNIAANLLKNHLEKPAQIYSKVGYENHSSFSKSFRKVFGKSPSQYQTEN